MLSIEDCKRYLSNGSYTDNEIEEIRDSCYKAANFMIDNYINQRNTKKGETHAKQTKTISQEIN